MMRRCIAIGGVIAVYAIAHAEATMGQVKPTAVSHLSLTHSHSTVSH
jgi:hypothetical protein